MLYVSLTRASKGIAVIRFCEAMISIREKIRAIKNGEVKQEDNLLKNAPHTAESLITSDWQHSYSRESAAYPSAWTREHKFWSAVGRIDNAYGVHRRCGYADRNLVCSCAGMEMYK